MNNPFNMQPSIDSMGRKLGVVSGFPAYTAQMLEYMKQDLGLYMNVSDLTLLKNYYAASKQQNITLSELYFLDTLLKNTHALPSSKAIVNLFTENDKIISTYNDLIAKYHYVNGNMKKPLSLGDIAKVGGEYMKKIGVTKKASNSEELKCFRTLEGDRMISSQRAECKPLPPETAFLMVTPTNEEESEEYISQFKRFSESEIFKSYVIDAVRVDERGIAFALSRMADGILGDLYSIPDVSYPAEISDLACAKSRSFIIALEKNNIPTVANTAGKFRLSLTYFAKSVHGSKFTLLNNRNASMCVDTELIRLFGTSVVAADFKLTGKKAIEREERYDEVLLNSGSVNRRLKYGDIVSLSGALVSVSRASFDVPDFTTGINTAISSILPLIACGCKLSEISLNNRYIFSGINSEEKSGDALALLLGVYRVMIELCLFDSAYIEFIEGSLSSLTCAAYSDIPAEPIPSHFRQTGNAVYLLSFERDGDGMPDFNSFRGMCTFLRELISGKKAVSVRALRGTPEEALENMRGAFEFISNSSTEYILNEKAQGFIVESNSPIASGILLGLVGQKPEQAV